jgi:Ribose/xylose/arabinose/galactoside ABC-type transport systems, permease components
MKSRQQRVKEFWLFWNNYGVVIIFLFVAAIFAMMDPRVIQIKQLISVLNRSSWVAVAAAGMTFAICSGGFDLSVGSIMSLSGCLTARLIMDNGLPTVAAILATLAIAVCCGVVNGLLITKLKIQPFVATLATMLIFDGVTQTYTNNVGTFIKTEQYEQGLKFLGRGMTVNITVNGDTTEISILKIILVVVLYSLAIVLYSNTKFGTKVRAVGSNELSARTSGINADNVLVMVYIITAVAAAAAAILYTATVQSASPDAGDGFELDAITAVVLGGSALSGGKGNLIGTFIGAFLVSFSKMCLNFLQAPEAMQVIVTGAILLFALSISGIKLITQREVG